MADQNLPPAISYTPDGITVDVAQFGQHQQNIANKVAASAQRQGVDPQLATNIAHTESRFRSDVTSPAGAVGPMQLMPATAKSLGVDPNDVDQNIDGGVKYLKQLSDKYNGDPRLIAAAYNAGPHAVDTHGGVPPYPETQDYVKKVTGGLKAETPPDSAFEAAQGAPSTSATPVGTSSPEVPPDDAFEVANNKSKTSNPQSLGYQKAYKAASAALKQSQNATSPLGGAFTNAFAAGTLPVLGGVSQALGTGIANFLHNNFGVGNALGYNMGEAYNAGRQATSNQLNTNANQHPVQNIVGETAGFLASPVTKAAGAIAAPVRALLPEAGALATAGRVALGAGEGALAGSGQGAGQGVSEGGTPGQIVHNALGYALPAAAGGALGEAVAPTLGKLFGAGTAAAHPAVQMAGRVGAGAMTGAIPGAAVGYFTGGVPGMEKGAAIGALGGALTAGRTVPKTEGYTPQDRAQALQEIASKAGPDLETAAKTLEQHPEEQHTTLEALGPKGQSVLETASKENGSNQNNLQQAIAQRQSQPAVKERLKSSINSTVGNNIENAGNDLANQTLQEQQTIGEQAQPANLVGTTAENVGRATGIDPRLAETNYDDFLENHRQTVSKPLWDAINSNAPVTDPAYKEILQSPQVKRSLARVLYTTGPEGMVPNPEFKGTTAPKSVGDLSQQELTDLVKSGFKSGDLKGTSLEDLQAHLDRQNPTQANNEPEQVPSQDTMMRVERDLSRQVKRDQFGKVEPDHTAEQENFLTEQSAKKLRDLNKEKIPGLAEAKSASGDEFSGEENEGLGFKLGARGETAESPEAFSKRYNQLDEGDKLAAKHGYLRHFYQDLTHTLKPEGTARKYSTEAHKAFQRTMFGDEGATEFGSQLDNARTIAQQARLGGPVQNTVRRAAQVVKSGDKGAFDRNYDATSDELKPIYERQYSAKINQAVEDLNGHGTNINETHLKKLEDLASSDFEKHVQNRIYGPERAEQIRQSIQREIDLAKSGKQALSVKAAAEPEDKSAFPFLLSGAASHGLKGAFHGLEAKAGVEAMKPIVNAIKEGRLTSAVKKAMGDILAQSPKETVQEIRNLHAQKKNTPLSKSTLQGELAKHSLRGLGYVVGANNHKNALSGVQ